MLKVRLGAPSPGRQRRNALCTQSAGGSHVTLQPRGESRGAPGWGPLCPRVRMQDTPASSLLSFRASDPPSLMAHLPFLLLMSVLLSSAGRAREPWWAGGSWLPEPAAVGPCLGRPAGLGCIAWFPFLLWSLLLAAQGAGLRLAKSQPPSVSPPSASGGAGGGGCTSYSGVVL